MNGCGIRTLNHRYTYTTATGTSTLYQWHTYSVQDVRHYKYRLNHLTQYGLHTTRPMPLIQQRRTHTFTSLTDLASMQQIESPQSNIILKIMKVLDHHESTPLQILIIHLAVVLMVYITTPNKGHKEPIINNARMIIYDAQLKKTWHSRRKTNYTYSFPQGKPRLKLKTSNH